MSMSKDWGRQLRCCFSLDGGYSSALRGTVALSVSSSTTEMIARERTVQLVRSLKKHLVGSAIWGVHAVLVRGEGEEDEVIELTDR